MSGFSARLARKMTKPQEKVLSLTKQRPRLLLLAYCFSPNGTMEERNGWQRAIMAARYFDVIAMYCPTEAKTELERNIPSDLAQSSLKFVPIADDWYSRGLKKFEPSFYFSYRHWHRLAFRAAKQIHVEKPFQLTHLVSLCGFREPGFVWQLGVPHIWGPIGGTHHFPFPFLHSLDYWNQFRETVRTVMNYYQLHRCRRVRKAMQRSAAVIAATKSAQNDLKSGFGIDTEVEIETGIDHAIDPPRVVANTVRPLRLLWAGRLRAWKGLPILLYAIASLPKTTAVQLRVVGDGSCEKSWRRLAEKLGIANNIEWLPWPTYRESLSQYRWADVFAFTSLRDTSGTGLVEALAAGCPIIGLDHQGAADIMSDQCAIRVSVRDWSTAVSEFRDGIVRLASDQQDWLQLSHGASQRASHYAWQLRRSLVMNVCCQLVDRSIETDIQAVNSGNLVSLSSD